MKIQTLPILPGSAAGAAALKYWKWITSASALKSLKLFWKLSCISHQRQLPHYTQVELLCKTRNTSKESRNQRPILFCTDLQTRWLPSNRFLGCFTSSSHLGPFFHLLDTRQIWIRSSASAQKTCKTNENQPWMRYLGQLQDFNCKICHWWHCSLRSCPPVARESKKDLIDVTSRHLLD